MGGTDTGGEPLGCGSEDGRPLGWGNEDGRPLGCGNGLTMLGVMLGGPLGAPEWPDGCGNGGNGRKMV